MATASKYYSTCSRFSSIVYVLYNYRILSIDARTYTVLILIELLSVAASIAEVTEHWGVEPVEESAPGVHRGENAHQKHRTQLHQTRSHLYCVCVCIVFGSRGVFTYAVIGTF